MSNQIVRISSEEKFLSTVPEDCRTIPLGRGSIQLVPMNAVGQVSAEVILQYLSRPSAPQRQREPLAPRITSAVDLGMSLVVENNQTKEVTLLPFHEVQTIKRAITFCSNLPFANDKHTLREIHYKCMNEQDFQDLTEMLNDKNLSLRGKPNALLNLRLAQCSAHRYLSDHYLKFGNIEESQENRDRDLKGAKQHLATCMKSSSDYNRHAEELLKNLDEYETTERSD